MKSIVLNSPRTLRLQECGRPRDLQKGEALVRTLSVGICGTDYHAFNGDFPFMEYPRVLGHELCVEVLKIVDGSDSELSAGDRCAVEPYINCEECLACRVDRYNCCSNMKVIGIHSDGGMREQFVLPINKLHPSNDIPIDHAAIVEMLAIGAHAVRRADSLAGKSVLVVGLGPIGLGVANFAKIAGAKVAVTDRVSSRTEFASTELNLTGLQSDNLSEGVQDHFGDLPQIVFDATGSSNAMTNSFSLVNNSGQLIFVGLVSGRINFESPLFHSREMTLKSSRNATDKDFRYVLDTLRNGQTRVENWITHHSSPEKLQGDIENWIDPNFGVIKGVLNFA